jgi:chromosomal replication initiator protein
MRKFVVPRQVAMFICRKYLKQSFPEIGETFEGKNHATGKKDHSTVIHSCRKIDSLLSKDQDLRKKIQNILNSIGIKEELD